MVLTRAQTKTGTAADQPKRPSARSATASSRARTKVMEEVKAKPKEQPKEEAKELVKDEPAFIKSKASSVRSNTKEAATKPKKTSVVSKPKPEITKSSVAKPEITTSRRAAEVKSKKEETQVKSRRVISTKTVTKPAVGKSTSKTVRKTVPKTVKDDEKEEKKPETPPEQLQTVADISNDVLHTTSLQLSPMKSFPISPTKALSPIKLSGSTILQTPRRSEAIRSAVKKLPVEYTVTETPHHNSTTIHESPRRGNTIRAAAMKLTMSEILPVKESPKSELKSSLASFKLLGTPMRRAFNPNKAPQTVSVFSPQKRPAMETPIRPRSAQPEKRFKITTPTRPQTADAPNSCMKREFTIKKSVTFEHSKTEISPIHDVESLQFHIMTPITEKSGERSSLSFGVLDSTKSPELVDPTNTILSGLVFYLDVWGSDGSSANQYFEPLLEEMGGKVVSEWSDIVTHVLFKDGNNATLNRVAQSGVHCVNVGWAVDCERRQTRLPENEYQYAIDLGLEQEVFPRTPLRPINSNTATPMIAKTPGTIKFGTELQALRESFPKLETPDFDKENWDSPASTITPLMQKSCPPKQENRTIFEEDRNASLKKALFKPSRQSLGAALKMTWDEE